MIFYHVCLEVDQQKIMYTLTWPVSDYDLLIDVKFSIQKFLLYK